MVGRTGLQVAVVDTGVEGYQSLVAGISSDVEIVLLDSTGNGLQQLADKLTGYQSIDALHIFSHGAEGAFFLAGDEVSLATLAEHRETLTAITDYLSEDGDLLLYGCDTAKGEQGQLFIDAVAELAGADVAASNDLTGATVLGGDWTLEYIAGELEASVIDSSSANVLLAAGSYIVGDGSGGGGHAPSGNGGNGGGDNDTITGTANDDVIVGDGSGGGSLFAAAGSGGSGNDILNGGAGTDLLFGDGFDGFVSSSPGGKGGLFGGGGSGTGSSSNLASGGYGGGESGQASTTDTDGHSAPSGGHFNNGGGGFGSAGSAVGGNGNDGDTDQHTLVDSGSTIHTAVSATLSTLLTNNPNYGNGADTLDGGAGSDHLFGLGGNDIFAFELDDASSGSDTDTIWDFNKNGEADSLKLSSGGTAIDSATRGALLAAQSSNGNDRTLTFASGGNSVAIVIKDIGRDVVVSDFFTNPPTVSGTPANITVTEDTASDVDFSAATFAEADGENITVTLTASAGTFSSPANGSSVGGGVTATLTSATTITLAGAAADINTYLDTTSNIQYTGASNIAGNAAATITVTATDGAKGLASDPTVNINITPEDDAPTVISVPDNSVLLQASTNLDLAASAVADVDSASLTAVVSVASGTLTAASAGGAHGGGATVAQTNVTTVTITGTPTQVDAYLNDTAELSFTSAASTGNVTLTVAVNDGVNTVVTDTATITVVDADQPTATTTSYSGTEETPVTLDTAGMAFAQDAVGTDALNYITITGINGGTLALGAGAAALAVDGTTAMAGVGALSAGALVNVNDVSKLTFTPATNSTSDASITYTVTDEGADASASATLTITLANTSDAPSGADKSISLNTSQSYTFSASDFGFTDPDSGDALNRVQIKVQTIDNGALKLSNVAVADNDWISLADISNLVYTPDSTGDDTFTFVVEDDSSANASDSSPNTLTLTVTSPPAPSVPTPTPGPETEKVDGVTVEKGTTTNSDGTTSSTVNISPVSGDRQEDSGTSNGDKADIPLRQEDDGKAALTVALPVGVGISAEGNDEAKTASNSLVDLIRYINEAVSDSTETEDKADMLQGGQAFLNTLQTDSKLWVNKITLSSNGNTQPGAPIVVSGNTQTTTSDGDDNSQAALVIDTSTLPTGSEIQLQDIEFAVIVGDGIVVRGGEGQNTVFAGSGSQNIVLGADDDQLYGGDGDDIVGSKGGDDLLFGENGNDTLFGGEGNDTLHGGKDIDTVTYDGNMQDYDVVQVGSVITVTNKADSTDSDTLVNVEQIQFGDQTRSLDYGTDLQMLATVYGQVLDRQADLGGFQFWAEAMGHGLSEGGVITSIMRSDEFQQSSGVQFDNLSASEQIELFYTQLLGRSSDIEGKAFWTGELNHGVSLEQVVEGFALSDELQQSYLTADSWSFEV